MIDSADNEPNRTRPRGEPHLRSAVLPASSPSAQLLASYASFGLAFVARPVGAAAFGHFGDRIGRKSTLVTSLLLMGGSTTAIAFLPTYRSVGLVAPALLCLLRVGQGLGLGGEWGGAALPSRARRQGGPAGSAWSRNLARRSGPTRRRVSRTMIEISSSGQRGESHRYPAISAGIMRKWGAVSRYSLSALIRLLLNAFCHQVHPIGGAWICKFRFIEPPTCGGSSKE